MTKKSKTKRAKYRDRVKSPIEITGQRIQPSSTIAVKTPASKVPPPATVATSRYRFIGSDLRRVAVIAGILIPVTFLLSRLLH